MNGQSNKSFLTATDAKIKSIILANIAQHYGITQSEAYDEVTDSEAEHLIDYVTGPQRAAASVLMQRHAVLKAQNF